MEVESEEECVIARVVGQSEGLAAGTKYSMAVRSWLNPPPGCSTSWSKWSDWAPIGCTSPTHHVVTHLRCVSASERGFLLAWMRPKLAVHDPLIIAAQQQQLPESWELPEPEPEVESVVVEWEYEVRMERTGARQAVQTLQAKLAGTITHLFNQAGSWQQADQTATDVRDAQASTDKESPSRPRPVTTDSHNATHCNNDSTIAVTLPVPESESESAERGVSLPAVGGSGVWNAVGGDRTKQMEVQHRLAAAEHSKEKLEAALMEAATILPDEQAVIRGIVRSEHRAVTCCAGEAPATETERAPHRGTETVRATERVLLRAGSRELEALEPGVTYRVCVRARPCTEEGETKSSEWGGWCPVVDMQTRPAAWNPPPVIESPVEGSEVVVGEGCVITWSWPAAANRETDRHGERQGETERGSERRGGHARVAVREILFTSQSGFHRHSIPVAVSASLISQEQLQPLAEADVDCFSWQWDGTLWPSAMPHTDSSRIYTDSPSPPAFSVFVYLRFVGVDGIETYTAARRLVMSYQPLLLITAPPTTHPVPSYDHISGVREGAVWGATAGDPVDIRWDMMEGVTVSHITLNCRCTSWFSSLATLASAPPPITLATATESATERGTHRGTTLTAVSTSYHWNGLLPGTSADLPKPLERSLNPVIADTRDTEADADTGSDCDFIELAAQSDTEGKLPTPGQYDIAVHCVAPPRLVCLLPSPLPPFSISR